MVIVELSDDDERRVPLEEVDPGSVFYLRNMNAPYMRTSYQREICLGWECVNMKTGTIKSFDGKVSVLPVKKAVLTVTK